MKKNVFVCGLLTCVIFLQGCSAKAPSYKDNWSEARNLANAGGLMMGIKDRPASEAKALYSGPGVGLGDLIAIANVGVGAFEGGVLGMSGAGSAAFNAAHGVWAVSDSDQWSANRFFAYVPQNQAHNQAEARKLLEDKLLSHSAEVLNGQGFKLKKIDKKILNDGVPVLQWSLVNEDYGCVESANNCVLVIYLNASKYFYNKPKPDFIGLGIGEKTWYTSALSQTSFNTIDVVARGLEKPLPELEFYQELSTKMPDWFVLYVGPGKAMSSKFKSGTLPYNIIVLNSGRTLEFMEP